MKQITPIIGISKIINSYDAVICGFDGVLTKGKGISLDGLKAIQNLHDRGIDVLLLSNSALRVKQMIEKFEEISFDLQNFKAIITAGEILHYKLKNSKTLGRKYYNLGGASDEGVFANLNYHKVLDLSEADFVFIGDVSATKMNVEDYNADIQTAVAMRLPLVCVGTDVSTHQDGEVCLGVGSVAEQYAVLGGKIISVGKPDKDVLLYAKEALSKKTEKILFAGDSILSDMKSAVQLEADMLLVSKGIHIHALGEGYIPDVQKTKQLAMNYNIYPDYLISELRW